MAYLLRIAALVLLGCFAGHAAALIQPVAPTEPVVFYAVSAGGAGQKATALLACEDYLYPRGVPQGYTVLRVDPPNAVGPQCIFSNGSSVNGFGDLRAAWQCTTSGFTMNAEHTICTGPTPACPSGSTAVSGGCQCNSPLVENSAHTACVTPPDACLALAGKEAGLKVWNGTASSFSFCDGWNPIGNGKCVVTAQKDISWPTSPTSGVWLSQGIGVYTGTSATDCSGDGGTGSTPAPSTPTPDGNPPQQPAPGEAAPSPCPAGQAPGIINGTAVCAARGSDVPVEGTDSKEVKNPDGSITRTDGTTRCQNGKCETDTRVCRSASEGAAETCETTTTTESQGGFCDANKGAKVCEGQGEGTPSGFGGTCAAGFRATGDDAVINAMALEQYKRNCAFFDKVPDATEDTQMYDAMKAKGKQGGDQTGDLPNDSKREFSIGAGDFDSSSAIGAQQCFSDKYVQIWGRSIAIPLSIVCPWLAILGNILVVVGYLLAARIVIRG